MLCSSVLFLPLISHLVSHIVPFNLGELLTLLPRCQMTGGDKAFRDQFAPLCDNKPFTC